MVIIINQGIQENKNVVLSKKLIDTRQTFRKVNLPFNIKGYT